MVKDYKIKKIKILIDNNKEVNANDNKKEVNENDIKKEINTNDIKKEVNENDNKKIIIETARKITAGQKKTLESIAKKGDLINEKINPELIAGVKIIINNNKQFDGSMKSKLQNIF